MDGSYSSEPGGRENRVGPFASYSMVAGRRDKTNHAGKIVWADSTDVDIGFRTNNQFLVRASGGVGINTTNNEARLHVFKGEAGADSGIAALDAIQALVGQGAEDRGRMTELEAENVRLRERLAALERKLGL